MSKFKVGDWVVRARESVRNMPIGTKVVVGQIETNAGGEWIMPLGSTEEYLAKNYDLVDPLDWDPDQWERNRVNNMRAGKAVAELAAVWCLLNMRGRISWGTVKPATVTIEIPREKAELYARWDVAFGHACRAALAAEGE